jgi:acetylglutamate kinase
MKFTKLEVVKSKNSLSNVITTSLARAVDFVGETIVIKISGSVLVDNTKLKDIVKNIVMLKFLGINIIIVHGGFDQVQEVVGTSDNDKKGLLKNLSPIETMEMVMTGFFAKNIVNQINYCGGQALAISGKEGFLIEAKKSKRTKSNAKIENILNIGYMGEVEIINPDILFALEEFGIIPVVSPLAFNESGETYQVNSDVLASVLAQLYSASRLIYITEDELIQNPDNENVKVLSISDAKKLIESDTKLSAAIKEKIRCCTIAIEEGVEQGLIITKWIENVLLIDLFSDENIGTKIIDKQNVT